MDYRVEKKYLCSEADLAVLSSRLLPLMQMDAHQHGGGYLIRSLYLDTADDRYFYENAAGVDDREKFRIRTYENDPATLRLEIKSKLHGYCHKDQTFLSEAQFRRMTSGRVPHYQKTEDRTLNRYYLQMAQHYLRPAAIIQYVRTAFVSPNGNVRITFDRNISVSGEFNRFFAPQPVMLPVLPAGRHILEVKYDELLPDYIAQALELGNLQQTAFSKYYLGRQVLGY